MPVPNKAKIAVLLVPLFPQESSTTTGTLVECAQSLARELGLELDQLPPFTTRWQPIC